MLIGVFSILRESAGLISGDTAQLVPHFIEPE